MNYITSAAAMQGKMLDWLEVRGRGGARSYPGTGKLGKRIASIDFQEAANDVRPFLKDASCLDIWSADYFNALTDMMQFA